MAVRVELGHETISSEPGQTATVDITVRNDGPTSAAVRLTLAGEPSSWGWLTQPDLSVPAGGEAGARICFQPPRSSNVPAGRYVFSATATSNASSVTVEGELDVLPVAEVSTRIEPRIAYGRSGMFTAIVENQGNAPASVAVTVEASDGASVTVEPCTLAVPAGGEARARIDVRGRRRALWRERSQALSVAAAVTGGGGGGAGTKPSAAQASGMLLDRPRRLRIALGTVVALVAAGVALAGIGGGGGGSSDGLAVGLPPLPVPSAMAVGVGRETSVDPTRLTPAQGDQPVLPSRTLVTTIYYPATGPAPTPTVGGAGLRPVDGAPPATAQGPFPLVVFSHGFGLSGRSASALMSYWASAGYVIAAPDYPLTSDTAPGGPQRSADFENQPSDAKFVLTEMLRVNGDDGSAWRGLIHPVRVAYAGYSMGGGVTLGAGFNSCCLDERARAAIVMAGGRPRYGGDYFAGPAVPVMFIHGERDTTVPYASSQENFAQAKAPKFLLTALDGDHGSPYSADSRSAEAALVVRATITFLDIYLKGQADALAQLRADVTRQSSLAKLEAVER